MGMDCLTRILVIALLVLAGSLSGCEEVRMQQLDAEYERICPYENSSSKFRRIQ